MSLLLLFNILMLNKNNENNQIPIPQKNFSSVNQPAFFSYAENSNRPLSILKIDSTVGFQDPVKNHFYFHCFNRLNLTFDKLELRCEGAWLNCDHNLNASLLLFLSVCYQKRDHNVTFKIQVSEKVDNFVIFLMRRWLYTEPKLHKGVVAKVALYRRKVSLRSIVK